MKPYLKIIVFICLCAITISCKKRDLTEQYQIPNKPPVANAGLDQTIILPANTVTLDGSGSVDSSNKITKQSWEKISGPSSFNITDSTALQTQVTSLVKGTYQFELRVTDANGLFSRDTMQIVVMASFVSDCNISDRPLVNVKPTFIGTLSEARRYVTIAAAGNKILFAGGSDLTDGSFEFSTVDIYDTLHHIWSTGKLSVPRYNMSVVTEGEKVFFSGGHTVSQNNWNLFSTVDIYDGITNTWGKIQLSERRMDLATVLSGNRILFGGGLTGPSDQAPTDVSNKVDIYDLSSQAWTTSKLSQSRAELSAVALGSKVYFAGGNREHSTYTWSCNPTNVADVYDMDSKSWSIFNMRSALANRAAISLNGKIYWAGGENLACGSDTWSLSSEVEIFDTATQTCTYSCLFQPNSRLTAVAKDNLILFFTGAGTIKDRFDIYDTTTGAWSIGVLPSLYAPTIYSYNNTVYVTDGTQVWKLEF